MTTIWAIELTSMFWSRAPHIVCTGRAGSSCGFLFLLLFDLFQRWVLVGIALYLLGTGWTDFGIAVGVVGTSNQTHCFWSCFYFQKPMNLMVEPVPSKEG